MGTYNHVGPIECTWTQGRECTDDKTLIPSEHIFRYHVPGFLQDCICTCPVPPGVYPDNWLPTWKPYTDLWDKNNIHWVERDKRYKNQFNRIRMFPSGSFCTKCMWPLRYTVVFVIVECEECEMLYVPRPEPGEYPLRWRICPRCV